MNFPGGYSKNGNMCFTIGPVIRVEKIPGNLGGFCQVDFRGSCVHRNRRWIPSGGFSIGIHLTESDHWFCGTEWVHSTTTEIKKKKGNKPLILPILAK